VLAYDKGPFTLDKSHRDSSTAFLPLPVNSEENDEHVVIKCIEEHAAAFQGNVHVEKVENLQVVKYVTHSKTR